MSSKAKGQKASNGDSVINDKPRGKVSIFHLLKLISLSFHLLQQSLSLYLSIFLSKMWVETRNSTLTKPKSCLRKTRRRRRRRRSVHALCGAERRSNNVCVKGNNKLSDKLEALKKLIPAHNNNNNNNNGKKTVLKADELFQETADYIVLLKTQVVILQKLIDFYGGDEEEQNQCVSSSSS